MSLTGRLYVMPPKPQEPEDARSSRKVAIETTYKDKGLEKLQQFIVRSQGRSSKREIVTDRPYSFTLFREVSSKDRSKREVKLPKGTVLYFFASRDDYFTFNEDGHSLVVDLDTGLVRYRHHPVAVHVLANSPATKHRLN